MSIIFEGKNLLYTAFLNNYCRVKNKLFRSAKSIGEGEGRGRERKKEYDLHFIAMDGCF